MNRTDDIAQKMRILLSLFKRELERVFMGLIILMALWSCSKEQDEPEPEPVVQEVISFSGSLQEATEVTAGTRAESTTPLSDIVQAFNVWAFKNTAINNPGNGDPINYTAYQTVINNYTVNWTENSANTTVTNSSGWEYVDGSDQSIKYWDFDAKAYKFFGITGNNEESQTEPYWAYTVSGANAVLSINNVDASNPTAAPYVSRLWFSNNSYVSSDSKYYGMPVKLEFIKPFAQVRFMFTKAEGVNVNLDEDISEQEFKPATEGRKIAMKGSVAISYPLTGTATKESWTSTPTGYWEDVDHNPVFFTQDFRTGQETWYTVLPISGQGAFRLVATVQGEEMSATVPAEFMEWHPGYSYTYIFKITREGGIEFDVVQVAIKNWEDRDVKHHVYNW